MRPNFTADPASHDAPSVMPPAKPWRRWLARMIDFSAVVTVLSLLVLLTGNAQLTQLPGYRLVFQLLSWVAVLGIEAILLATVGTTLGKAILNIRVSEQDGQRLTLRRAADRATKVWWSGLALGIPVASLFTIGRQYLALTRQGVTTYDATGAFRVSHGRIGPARVVTLILVAGIVFWGLMLRVAAR